MQIKGERTSFKVGMNLVGTDVYCLALLELCEVHEERSGEDAGIPRVLAVDL